MIAFFEDQPGAQDVAQILDVIINQEAKGFMSIVNWGEMFYCTIRVQGFEEAEYLLGQFNRYPIELVPADKGLTYEAAKLKARHKIAYADCFAASLSLKLDAPVVTGDPEFKRLKDEISIHWIGTK
jgi:ribonuclease VapC